jgi:leucyl-tRNA synthetase
MDVFSEFFAKHKGVNRRARYIPFIVELDSDEFIHPQPEHIKNHNAVWLDKNDVEKFINLENNRVIWDNYIKGGYAFTEYGILFNSGKFNDLTSEEAKEKITEELNKHNLGRKVTNFKLRDWLISRQRFWGTPIPVVYCAKCGTVPVHEKDLPVELPENINFSDVKNPLIDYEPFVNTKCPECQGPAKRETDTMDTFVDSSWYYLRYTDPKNDEKIFNPALAKKWRL